MLTTYHTIPSMRAVFFVLAVAGPVLLGPGVARADYPQIRINSDSTQELQNEQQICVNPLDPDNVVACWRDFRLGYRQVGVGYSVDGGLTWTDFLIGGELPWDSDPVLTAHDDGTFYLVVINYQDGAQNQLSVHRSTTGGSSWDGPFTAVFSNGSTFEDKEWIAVDRTGGARDGYVYVAWSRFYDVKIMCVRSVDRGENWSGPVQVSDAGVTAQWPVPLTMMNGNLLIAWDNYGSPKIAYDVSTNGGSTWGTDRTLTTTTTQPQETINGGITIFPHPALAQDETSGPRRGTVYCVYADRAVSQNGVDVWCRRSTDYGFTWSNRVRVNDDTAGLVRDQFHPWVCCDEQGILTAIWYDRRDDVANYLWHIYMSRSLDGGLSWEPNVRITDVPSSPGDAGFAFEAPDAVGLAPLAGQLRAGLIGEYSGVAVARGVIHPVWTDTRNGNQDTFTSVLRAPAGVDDIRNGVVIAGLRGYPNPSSGGCEIHVRMPDTDAVRDGIAIEIFRADGARVRLLETRFPVGAASDLVVPWDGLDDVGRPAPAGVYHARVVGSDALAGIRTKLVLAR